LAKLHEYECKNLLKNAGIAVPEGRVANTPEEASAITAELKSPVVIKMQAWTTGRAEMGGIKFADTPEEAQKKAGELLGMKVKNFIVENVLVEEKLDIEKEYYAGVIIDDKSGKPMMIFSSVGGTGIEEIAKESPDKIARVSIDILEGLRDYQARELLRQTGITGKLQMKIAPLLVNLFNVAKKNMKHVLQR